MGKIDVFSDQDLKERTPELIQDAENGCLSLITSRGRPTILAVPFDSRLLEHGLDKTLAVKLFEEKIVSLSRGAEIAGTSIEGFLALLSESDIPVVDYDPDDVDEELRVTW